MPANQPKTVDAEPTLDASLPVIWTPPADPGDAGGVGNGDQRNLAPGTEHEMVDEVPAREEAARLAGTR